MMGVSVDELVRRYPRLFHVCEESNLPGIQRHGLLSTAALCDLFELPQDAREAILLRHRPESVEISHPVHGAAVIRDQKPMDDNGLRRALQDGLHPLDWYALLNQHVFFWLDRERVERLLSARAYRGKRFALLTVKTQDLLDRHADRTVLSPLNTGATKPMPHPRGKDCFLPLSEYPFEAWLKKRNSRQAVVELAVRYSVPDLMGLVEGVSVVAADGTKD